MEVKLQDNLEIAYIDKLGLSNTIEAIADICLLKAEHIRENWQDYDTAKVWDSLYRKLNNCLATIKNDADIVQGLK